MNTIIFLLLIISFMASTAFLFIAIVKADQYEWKQAFFSLATSTAIFLVTSFLLRVFLGV